MSTLELVLERDRVKSENRRLRAERAALYGYLESLLRVYPICETKERRFCKHPSCAIFLSYLGRAGAGTRGRRNPSVLFTEPTTTETP